MNNEQDQRLHDAARDALDKKNVQLPTEMKRALQQARIEALKHQDREQNPMRLWGWSLQRSLYPTGIAMAAILVAVFWLPNKEPQNILNVPENQFSAETLDMLSAEEDLTFYEDLEFINWLATQSEQG